MNESDLTEAKHDEMEEPIPDIAKKSSVESFSKGASKSPITSSSCQPKAQKQKADADDLVKLPNGNYA